jgi:hypothetical protein
LVYLTRCEPVDLLGYHVLECVIITLIISINSLGIDYIEGIDLHGIDVHGIDVYGNGNYLHPLE